MFDQLKQFKDLMSQARTINQMMAEEKIEVEKDGIKMVMNGKQEILSLDIPENILVSDLGDKIKSIVNEGVKKSQAAMAGKIKASGNFNM